MENNETNGIEYLRERVIEILKGIAKLDNYRRDSLEFQILCSAITLRCLNVDEDIKRASLNAADALVWHEIANALKQIAFHTVELQSEYQDWDVAFHLNWIYRHSAYIQKTVPLPSELVPVKDFAAVVAAENFREELEICSGVEPTNKNAGNSLTVFNTENAKDRLRREIKELREQLISLTVEKENLENIEKPRLNAEYMLKIGSLQAELMMLETELRCIKRKIILAQTEIAREKTASEEKINEAVAEEYKAYKIKYDEYIKKQKEAENVLRKQAERARKAGSYKQNEYSSATGDSEVKNREDAGEVRDTEKNKENTNPGDADKSAELGDRSDGKANGIDYMKKLYRKIVKAMHPDLHPNQSEYERELFKKANLAYEDGDLDTLEKIYSIIENGMETEAEGSAIEALIREKQRLLDMIMRIRSEIRNIKNRFPFTLQEMLSDPEKILAEQEKIKTKIALTKQQIEEYTKRYEVILREHEH